MIAVRKVACFVEDLREEAGQSLAQTVRKVVVAAAVHNPFAGRFVEDLTPLARTVDELGPMMVARAVELLGPGRSATSYGKAAIVGLRGELEHGAALLHPLLGKYIRAAIGQGRAVIPSVTKRAAAGTVVDIPLHQKDDEWSFNHFDTVSMAISDVPLDDEIMLAIALADNGRPLARVSPL